MLCTVPKGIFIGMERDSMDNSFILKGMICYTPEPDNLVIRENAYIVCENGCCRGVFDKLPEAFSGLELIDCKDQLIIPGLTDLHTHAPQYPFCGTGMDFQLLEWLDHTAFPEEIRYADEAYAAKAYSIFADQYRTSATTRAVIFGTIHVESTLILMDCMEKSGLISYVGKVNMDRNAPSQLLEADAGYSADETRRFLEEWKKRGYVRTRPIVTPRFAISCSDELMEALGEIRREYELPVQSHLSENPEEIQFVKELCPWSSFYGDVYDRFGLFGKGSNTIMAHCVYSPPEEVERLKQNGVWVAHCPSSNMNLGSGIAPVRSYLNAGLKLGLGSDLSGGNSQSLFRAVTDAIQVSKLYWRQYTVPSVRPLTFPNAFYLATKGGGAFFGSVGSFEEGYSFDAVVLDDSVEPSSRRFSVRDRLERAFYLELDKKGIVRKYVGGNQIL